MTQATGEVATTGKKLQQGVPGLNGGVQQIVSRSEIIAQLLSDSKRWNQLAKVPMAAEKFVQETKTDIDIFLSKQNSKEVIEYAMIPQYRLFNNCTTIDQVGIMLTESLFSKTIPNLGVVAKIDQSTTTVFDKLSKLLSRRSFPQVFVKSKEEGEMYEILSYKKKKLSETMTLKDFRESMITFDENFVPLDLIRTSLLFCIRPELLKTLAGSTLVCFGSKSRKAYSGYHDRNQYPCVPCFKISKAETVGMEHVPLTEKVTNPVILSGLVMKSK